MLSLLSDRKGTSDIATVQRVAIHAAEDQQAGRKRAWDRDKSLRRPRNCWNREQRCCPVCNGVASGSSENGAAGVCIHETASHIPGHGLAGAVFRIDCIKGARICAEETGDQAGSGWGALAAGL